MSKINPELLRHRRWLNLIDERAGLVVAPTGLIKHALVPLDDDAPALRALQNALIDALDDAQSLPDPAALLALLGWPDDALRAPDPDRFTLPLPEHHDALRPDRLLFDGDHLCGLVWIVPAAQGLDADVREGWQASPTARAIRLLHEVEQPFGLLLHPDKLRILYAPRGESSGWLTFPFHALANRDGRPMLAALHAMLEPYACANLLPQVMRASREAQGEVSTDLAAQVLDALWALLRGFEEADRAAAGELLGGHAIPRDLFDEHVYGGLVAALMRLVFLLYAEDAALMPTGDLYLKSYSVSGLFSDLLADSARHQEALANRYGAWARLLALFRLVFDGELHPDMTLPARHGDLFDPDRFPFLEGRPHGHQRQLHERLTPPHLSDQIIFEVLEKLLVLDGERLSYRALDVEQIGSVYEAIMGFRVERVEHPSIALRGKDGADVVIALPALLAAKDRKAWVKEQADVALPAKPAKALAAARTVEEACDALASRISRRTPNALVRGALALQPTSERRRTGSHYTPRALTEPIVRRTLGPVIAGLGASPRAEALLQLKVCDPAMGSGAFLVEACRQLAEAVVEAWRTHGDAPRDLPPSESPLIHARRLVAERCLYGVDRNRFAVDLARLSLWLFTLAREQPFTFLDHALRHGDSLVGLSLEGLRGFHWDDELGKQQGIFAASVDAALNEALVLRKRISGARDGDDDTKRFLYSEAEAATRSARALGDLVVTAFFEADKDKAREAARKRLRDEAAHALSRSLPLPSPDPALVPFHWPLEFPEVFRRPNPGFDAFVGNPPFAGKNTIAEANAAGYPAWLKQLHTDSHGNADLVAHFFRRAFAMLRESGCMGLIATNTIAQGDTRASGLRHICTHGGAIYHATRRLKWPGLAAVVVSVVHITRGPAPAQPILNGKPVPQITAYLFHDGGHNDPRLLPANADKSYIGSYILGMGFTFDDETKKDASPLALMHELIVKDPRNANRIFPYLGGDEINSDPEHRHRRYVINFEDITEEEAREWPDLMAIVEAKVKPERMMNNREGYKRYWWQYGEKRVDLYKAIRGMDRVLGLSRVSSHLSVAALTTNQVLAESVVVFPLDRWWHFGVMQSRAHEVWAKFFSSSMKDDMRYSPSDCFETFPFPYMWAQEAPDLEEAGRRYYERRAEVMRGEQIGLTALYNRFHDPECDEAAIEELRGLHAAMDEAVLRAYGWWEELVAAHGTEGRLPVEFLLEWEEDEEDEGGKKKKPYRLRWPDALRDEVLARLLKLNEARHREEARAGSGARQARLI